MRSLESEAERATAKKCFKYFTSPTLIQLSTGLLQIGRDMLLIITITGDMLLSGINIEDLE